MKKNKKALYSTPTANQEHDLIIANKTYSVKELKSVFNVHTLMLVESKSKLLEYERMAEETGIKHFQNVVNIVWKENLRFRR